MLKKYLLLTMLIIGIQPSSLTPLATQSVMPLSIGVGCSAAAVTYFVMWWRERDKTEKSSITKRLLWSTGVGASTGLLTYLVARTYSPAYKIKQARKKTSTVREQLNAIEKLLPAPGVAVNYHVEHAFNGTTPLVTAYEQAKKMTGIIEQCDSLVDSVARIHDDIEIEDSDATAQEKAAMHTVQQTGRDEQAHIDRVKRSVELYIDAIRANPDYARQSIARDREKIASLERKCKDLAVREYIAQVHAQLLQRELEAVRPHNRLGH